MAAKAANKVQKEIEKLEKQLLKDKIKLAKLRHQAEPIPVEDFVFTTAG